MPDRGRSGQRVPRRVLTDSCSQRRYQRQSICQARSGVGENVSNPFRSCSWKSSNKFSDTLLRHSWTPSQPCHAPFAPFSEIPLIWEEEGACQLHEPSQSYVMRLVCGLRGRETTEECCVTPRRTTTTGRTYKRTVELATWRWQRPHERKNRISNKILTWYFQS